MCVYIVNLIDAKGRRGKGGIGILKENLITAFEKILTITVV